MSLMTKAIGTAKKVKHRFQDQIRARTPVYLSPVRRIERVALGERVCAMTFDDGPCRLPANPDGFGGRPLTLVLAETLEKYGAAGSFDVVGDTSGNYPDQPGKEGEASWGGVAYDHYPDFGKDGDGGVLHCPELVDRLVATRSPATPTPTSSSAGRTWSTAGGTPWPGWTRRWQTWRSSTP